MILPKEEQEGPPFKKLCSSDSHAQQEGTGQGRVAGRADGPNVGFKEPCTQSWECRRDAWLALRQQKRKDRRFGWDRLRDAMALQDSDMVSTWKSFLLELGPDVPDECMPPFTQ